MNVLSKSGGTLKGAVLFLAGLGLGLGPAWWRARNGAGPGTEAVVRPQPAPVVTVVRPVQAAVEVAPEALDRMKSVRRLLRGGTLGKDLPDLLNRIGGLTVAEAQELLRQSRIMVNEGIVPKNFGETVMLTALSRLAELDPGAAVREMSGLNRMRMEGAAVILERVAAQDPQRAAALLAGELQDAVGQESDGLAAKLSGAWAARDYDAALAWSKGLTGAMKGRALAGLVEAAYDRNPQDARDLLGAIDDPASRGVAEGKLFHKIADKDPAEALAYLKTNGDDPKQQGRHRFLFKQWADGDLSASVHGLEDLTGAAKQAATESVMEVWAQSRPAEAADWVAAQPAGTAEFATLSELTTGWGKLDPEAASRWVKNLPSGPQKQGAIWGLVNSQQARDSASAVAWAEQLTDPQVRQRSLGTCFFRWRRTDAASAGQWLEATTALTEAQKEPLRQSR